VAGGGGGGSGARPKAESEELKAEVWTPGEMRFEASSESELVRLALGYRRVPGTTPIEAVVVGWACCQRVRGLGRGEMWQTRGGADMGETQWEVRQPPGTEDPVLSEIVRRLVEVYRPERIYLFGSAARGDAGPDSDYDFMVVVPDGQAAICQDFGLARRVLRDLRVAKDILVWTKNDFDRRLHLMASLPATIAREGKLLYAA